jgi:hypothetical protein
MSVIINGNGTITNDAGAGIDFGGENISTTGVVSGVGSGLTAIPAANLTGTLAAGSGANLTALNASELGSGTIPDARFPATLPAASAANLTALPAANIRHQITQTLEQVLPTAAPLHSQYPAGSMGTLDTSATYTERMRR